MSNEGLDIPCGDDGVRKGIVHVGIVRAFSLVEMLVVITLVSVLMAFAAPNIVPMTPSREAAAHELITFLEIARAEAVASQEERAVAFGDEKMEDGSMMRTYALFRLAQSDIRPLTSDTISPADATAPTDSPRLYRTSAWRKLPEGLFFVQEKSRDSTADSNGRTIFDLSPARQFPIPGPDGRDAALAELPCLVFSPKGGVLEPGFADADALRIGIVRGRFETASKRVTTFSSKADVWVEIGSLTGRIRMLPGG